MSKLSTALGYVIRERCAGVYRVIHGKGLSVVAVLAFAGLGLFVVALDRQAAGLRADLTTLAMKLDRFEAAQPSVPASGSAAAATANRTPSGPLQSPMSMAKITVPYGWSMDEQTGDWHFGTDVVLSADAMRDVYAAQSGSVTRVESESQGTTRLTVDHGASRLVTYGGLTDVALKVGDEVWSGQPLGRTARLSLALAIDGVSENPVPKMGLISAQNTWE